MEIHLKELRRRAGLSQDEIASRLGIKKSRYGTWERGERMLSLKQAYDCALVLGCTIDEIAGLDRERLRSPDPRRQSMLDSYDALTDDGKTLASEMVASVARDPLRRADAAGAGSAGSRPAPDRADVRETA
ncbi:helix-turn-helix transcriptional regulator [Enorma massiliensis]|uniref:helix-turn-helix transcriptional regulator n=1 Tax=Enorma massiliensis TaxID=1472761 RepID=UPI0023EFF670|nr:helix-turn-helix transcriptional regulator [Enorma massiliensis]